MTVTKIDTHQHCFPKPYLDAVGLELLASQMPNKKAPDWSPERAIDMMDRHGIGEGIISVSSGPPVPNAPKVLRQCNEAVAELRQRHPGRFGSFASLPMPDLDASLAEIGHALDHLNAEGFILFASYDGRYLGDAQFLPLLEELNRREAVVLIHPNTPPYPDLPVAPASVLEFPFETTRAATSLILSGAMHRFRDIKFILSHAGGTLPYLLPRLTLSARMMREAGIEVGDPTEAIRQFYFDTALAGSLATLAALAAVAEPGHILFGTDFPMAPEFAIRDYGPVLDRIGEAGLDKHNVFRGNAERLFRRVPTTAG
jgi:predicted TIM-barrel fold metal-dependent hydrolase